MHILRPHPRIRNSGGASGSCNFDGPLKLENSCPKLAMVLTCDTILGIINQNLWRGFKEVDGHCRVDENALHFEGLST